MQQGNKMGGLLIMLLTNLAFACKSGFYSEGEDCKSCHDYDLLCRTCTSSKCLECEDTFYLDNGKCIKGEYSSECTLYEPCEHCKDCSECNAQQELCKNCSCLKCLTVLEVHQSFTINYTHPSYIQTDNQERAKSITFIQSQLNCEGQNYEFIDIPYVLSVREETRIIYIMADLQVKLHEGTFLQLIFDNYEVEIEILYSAKKPGGVNCYFYNEKSQKWDSGCDLFDVFSRVPLKISSRSVLKEVSCNSSLLSGLILLPLILICFLLMMANLTMNRINSYSFIDGDIKTYQVEGGYIKSEENPVNPEEINEIYKNSVKSPMREVIVNEEDKEDSSIEEINVMYFNHTRIEGCWYNFITHHLVLGQLRIYYYSTCARNLLLVLNGSLNFLCIEAIILFNRFPLGPEEAILDLCAASTGSLFVVYSFELFLAVFSEHKLTNALLGILLVLCLFATQGGILYLSYLGCTPHAMEWAVFGLVSIAFDWIVTQTAVAGLKTPILFV